LYQDENYKSSGRVLVIEANYVKTFAAVSCRFKNNLVVARVPDSGVVKSNAKMQRRFC
jgi:hypothetical protein